MIPPSRPQGDCRRPRPEGTSVGTVVGPAEVQALSPPGGAGERAAALPNVPHTVAWADVPVQPWRNGGGVTRELLAWPAGDEWQVRVSVADIDRSGPFSAFPGIARWFAVLEGDGVVLTLPGGEVALQPGSPPCAFDGADAPGCRLVGGSTRDLNLMLRDAGGRLAPVAEDATWLPEAPQCGLFARVAGEVCFDDGKASVALPAMSLTWWSVAPTSLRWRSAAGVPSTGRPGWWLAATPQAPEARE